MTKRETHALANELGAAAALLLQHHFLDAAEAVLRELLEVDFDRACLVVQTMAVGQP